ncbi:MAG: hypothetical protein ACOYL9_05180 [Ilumatobacteraceae bacterium]
MWTARRATGRARGIAVLVVVGFTLSVAVVPAGYQVVAEEPLTDTAPTTVPESPPSEPTVPAEPSSEPTVSAEPTSEPTDATPIAAAGFPGGPCGLIGPLGPVGLVKPGELWLAITEGGFAVIPNRLDFGTHKLGATATEPVTLVNCSSRQVAFELFARDGVSSVTNVDWLCAGGVWGDLEHVVESGQTCTLSVTVDTSSVGSVTGRVELVELGTGQSASAQVTAEVVAAGTAPANDDWANAEDLSALSIPAVGAPSAEVLGSTVSATYEPNEYNPRVPGGSVWYKYTSPQPGGFAGRLGIRATPGFAVRVSTENTSAAYSLVAMTSGSGYRMEPGHTVWISVYNETPGAAPGPFTLELFEAAPSTQDSIENADDAGFVGDFAGGISLGFSGDTFRLTPDQPGGAPNGWFTMSFAVPGTLRIFHRSVTAKTIGPMHFYPRSEGSRRPVGMRVYRSPEKWPLTTDPAELTEVAVGTSSISSYPWIYYVSGDYMVTVALVRVVPGRYYWTAEEGEDGPTFFITDAVFEVSSGTDTEPPAAAITTPPDGVQYTASAVPSNVVASCRDNQGPATSSVTVDGVQTTSLATSPGSHTVSLECRDSAGNTSSASSTYTVAAPDTTPPTITITGVANGQIVTRASPAITISSNEPLFAALCTLDTPTAGGGSVSNDIGCMADGTSVDSLTLAELPDGPVTFAVSGVDAAGNRGQASVTFRVDVAPVVTISAPADGAVLSPIDVPAAVQYSCSDNSGVVLPDVEIVVVLPSGPVLLTGAPPSTAGTHTIRVLCFDGDNTEGVGEVTYTVIAPPTGPCVIIDTQPVDFGEVAVGSTSATRPVVVRSCSDAPVRLAVSVSNATAGGGPQTWVAGTSTVPSANQFTWSITPPGGPSPTPVGPTLTTVGLPLAARASRTDDHRVTLGPTGPGLGIRFTSTLTYTAMTP